MTLLESSDFPSAIKVMVETMARPALRGGLAGPTGIQRHSSSWFPFVWNAGLWMKIKLTTCMSPMCERIAQPMI